MRAVVCIVAVMLIGIGCSKSFMCHLNGTQCPAGQATSSSGGGGGGEQESTSEPASEEKKPTEEAPAPAKSDCLPAGAKTDNYHRCCCDCMKTQVEPDPNIHTCG